MQSSMEPDLFPSFSDRHTVALWLFDEPQYFNVTLTDASENWYDLRLLSGGQLAPGKFGGALRVSPQAGPAVVYPYISRNYNKTEYMIPDLRPVLPPQNLLTTLAQKDWTLEFWLKMNVLPEADATIIEMGTGRDVMFCCSLTGGGWTFILGGSSIGDNLVCPTDAKALSDGQWHHVAFTRNKDDGKVCHFLDGRSQPAAMTGQEMSAIVGPKPGLVGAIFRQEGRDFGAPLNIRATGQVNSYWDRADMLNWAERWRGILKAPVSGEVTFWVEAEDGVRLVIGDEMVIDGWDDRQARSGILKMVAGQMYPMRLEFLQEGETSRMRLLWRLPGHDWALVPGEALWHTSEDEEAARSEAGAAADERFDLTIGSGRLFDRPLDGMLDEMRISDVIRYTEDFPVPGSFSRNYGENPPKPGAPTSPPLLFAQDAEPGPVQLGSRKHVFIDDVMIEAREFVHLKSNPPEPRQEDIKGTETVPPSTYDYKGRELRFVDNSHFPAGTKGARCFEDANPDILPEERFKATGRVNQRGIYLFVSPDGIHWRRNETIMYPFDPDGGVETFWDDQRGVYVTYIRHMGWNMWHPPFGRAAAMGQTREILKPWPFQPQPNPSFFVRAWTLPTFTEELPVPFKPYNPDNPNPPGHIYRTRAVKYPWAPDTYVAFPWRLFDFPEDERRQTELATSRDGQNWKFYGEPYYYPYGWEMEEGVKVIEALSVDALVRRGDELWQYTMLTTTSHHGKKMSAGRSRTVRYVQRLDGFVSLDAGEREGWAMTRPFVFDGNRLVLNVVARGQVRVCILDEEGNAIPEFTVDDCDPIRADSVRQVVTWSGNPDVSKLAGGAVRLRFVMQDAKLYAFQFVKAQKF